MVYALAMHPDDPDIMYAGTHSHYAFATASRHDALYKTTNGGRTWTVPLGNGAVVHPKYPFINFGGGVDAIVINPSRPEEVYVALHDTGIIFTENGGADWRWVNHGLIPLLTHSYPYRMAISYDGETLYATTCGRSVFKNQVYVPEGRIASGKELGSLRGRAHRPCRGPRSWQP
jgi:photosystem II stability/assembly factor-like uncharacterized protein